MVRKPLLLDLHSLDLFAECLREAALDSVLGDVADFGGAVVDLDPLDGFIEVGAGGDADADLLDCSALHDLVIVTDQEDKTAVFVSRNDANEDGALNHCGPWLVDRFIIH